MNKTKFSKEIEYWSVLRRVEFAKHTIDKLTHPVLGVVQLSETNNLVTYSNVLASQIPASMAAMAYKNLQRSLHEYEVIRICTFWDAAYENAQTIPTIIEVIDSVEVTSFLADKWRSQWVSDLEYANQQAFKQILGLREVVMQARAILQSDRFKTIKALRDRNLAHSLT